MLQYENGPVIQPVTTSPLPEDFPLLEDDAISILLVDPSAFARAALMALLQSEPGIQLVGAVRTVDEALTILTDSPPDLTLVGFGPHPEEALSFIRLITSDVPRTVMALLPPGADVGLQLDALEAGAAMLMPMELEASTAALLAFQSLLLSRIKSLSASRGTFGEPHTGPLPSVGQLLEQPGLNPVELLVIAVGIGGVAPAMALLSGLPAAAGACVLVLTRLGEQLPVTMVERLTGRTALPIQLAREGDPCLPGRILVCPAGVHAGLVRTGRKPRALLRLQKPQDGLNAAPSFDRGLRAGAMVYGPHTLAVLLSGQGRDGVEGLAAVRAAGGKTLVLDPEKAIIADTSRAAVQSDCADAVADLPGLIAACKRLLPTE